MHAGQFPLGVDSHQVHAGSGVCALPAFSTQGRPSRFCIKGSGRPYGCDSDPQTSTAERRWRGVQPHNVPTRGCIIHVPLLFLKNRRLGERKQPLRNPQDQDAPADNHHRGSPEVLPRSATRCSLGQSHRSGSSGGFLHRRRTI